jgi:hypothetical protein
MLMKHVRREHTDQAFLFDVPEFVDLLCTIQTLKLAKCAGS